MPRYPPIHLGRTGSNQRRAVPEHTTESVSDQPDPAASEPQAGSESSDLLPLRVLIVDDGGAMPGVLRQLTDGITTGRYVVERATTLADGFGALVGEDHDVCIVDHHIGVRTGFDLLSRITDEGLHIPIIFVAEPGDHGTGVTAVEAGASCYVVEDGIGSEHLDQCLRQAVEERRTLSRLTSAGVAIDRGTPKKPQIFSHIAERLSDPANAILDTTRATLRSDLSPHAAQSLAAIEDQVATILTLAHDLDDLSMLESGRLVFDSAPFSLRGLVAGVKRVTGSASGSSRLTVIDEVSAEIPDSLIGDPGRLRLVLVRFVDNVARRGNASRIRLKTVLLETTTETVTVQFEVTPVDADPIEKTPTVETETGTGSDLPGPRSQGGLGIPVALETVSRMGGHITITNEVGEPPGITCTIRLQISDDEIRSRPDVDAEVPVEEPILIIAESLDDRRSIVKTLGESGLSYVVNSSVAEWAASRESNGNTGVVPALAVVTSSDDSFASCDRFRSIAGDVPIVAIASTGRRGDAARCRNAGARGYLAQPMNPGDLVDIINATLALVESGDTSTLVTRHWLSDGRPSLHALVVDDSETSRFLMTRMLDQRGHSTESACDGAEAVGSFEPDKFDVVLMDIMMPGVDGFEATQLIRGKDMGSTRRPLIVGVSAFADQANTDRGRAAGMDAMLEKPIRPDDLFALIEKLETATTPTR